MSKGFDTRNRMMAAERDAAIGRIAMRFIDRAGDTCEEDTAETICAEFYAAILEEVNRQGSGGEGEHNG